METTLGKLLDAKGALEALAAQKMPAGLAVRVARNLRKVGQELEDFYEEHRKLVHAYAEVEDETQPAQVPPEKLDAFRAELESMLAERVELDARPIAIAELGAHVTLTPQEAMALDWMLLDEEV